MASRISAVSDNSEWKQAYLAAVLEKNRSTVLGLIETAKRKLQSRHFELMAGGLVPCDEEEAIHDAYYLLKALESSLPFRQDLLS